jgi:phosphate transport system protein
MPNEKHILATFDEALSSLRNSVLMMASLTERSLDRAITGLLQRDDEMCAIAIADDEEIDQLEKQVDKDGIDLLLRFQPVASDLRRVVSAMKLSSNLERMADQGTNIARRARKLNQHPALPEAGLIKPMYAHAMTMFKDALDAYIREDVQLARSVVPRDQGLDEMNSSASRRLIERMAEDPDQLRGYLNLIFISRCLERVGDHATNMAEDAVYAAAAEDIRHQHFVT